MTEATARSLLVALAAGLLLGLEREWSKRNEPSPRPAGSRTFAFASLLGALARLHSITLVGVAVAVVALFGVAGYVRNDSNDVGLTSEFALVAAVFVGSLAIDDERLAVLVAVVLAALLASRDPLHRFAREWLTKREVEDTILFFVCAFVVLPLLPTEPIGPYSVLNPAQVWRMVVLVVGVGLVGHVATRWVGSTKGLLVTGLAGGFVSGAATTASMAARARRAEGREPRRAALGGALAASISTMVQLTIVVASTDEAVVKLLLPTLLTGIGTTFAVVAAMSYPEFRRVSSEQTTHRTQGDADQPKMNPDQPSFRLTTAVLISAAIAVVLIVTAWASDRFGVRGSTTVAAIAGFADVHAVSISMATLAKQRTLGEHQAVIAIGVALLANTVTKCILAFTAGGRRVGAEFLLLFVVPGVVTGAVFLLTV